MLSTLRHTVVEVTDPESRHFITLLDGTLTRGELATEMARSPMHRRPLLLDNWMHLDQAGANGAADPVDANHAHPYAKSLFSIVTLASFNVSLASERLRNSRDNAGSSVLVMILSIMRPPVSGSLHIDTM